MVEPFLYKFKIASMTLRVSLVVSFLILRVLRWGIVEGRAFPRLMFHCRFHGLRHTLHAWNEEMNWKRPVATKMGRPNRCDARLGGWSEGQTARASP